MPAMLNNATSEYSFDGSVEYTIRDEIDATVTKLKLVINEEASLRKMLHCLFVKRKEQAIEQVKQANIYLYLVNNEETAFCEMLKEAAATANKDLGVSTSICGAKPRFEPPLQSAAPVSLLSQTASECINLRGTLNEQLKSPPKTIHGLASAGSPVPFPQGFERSPPPTRLVFDRIHSIPQASSPRSISTREMFLPSAQSIHHVLSPAALPIQIPSVAPALKSSLPSYTPVSVLSSPAPSLASIETSEAEQDRVAVEEEVTRTFAYEEKQHRLLEAEVVTLAEAERLKEAEAQYIRQEEDTARGLQLDAAMAEAVEERRKAEAEMALQDLGEADRLAPLEMAAQGDEQTRKYEERVAEELAWQLSVYASAVQGGERSLKLENERLGEAEADRLATQEAAMVAENENLDAEVEHRSATKVRKAALESEGGVKWKKGKKKGRRYNMEECPKEEEWHNDILLVQDLECVPMEAEQALLDSIGDAPDPSPRRDPTQMKKRKGVMNLLTKHPNFGREDMLA